MLNRLVYKIGDRRLYNSEDIMLGTKVKEINDFYIADSSESIEVTDMKQITN